MIVLFDLDGTVWDSAEGIVGSAQHALAEVGVSAPDDVDLAAGIGPPLQAWMESLGVPPERLDRAVAAYRERYEEWGAHQVVLHEGIVEVLDALVDSGHRLGTATSKGEVPARQMLVRTGLIDRFEVVAAASMDGSSASKEAVVARALAGFGDPDPLGCVLVGDRHHDVAGARHHGLHCIGVLWGHGSHEELTAAGAGSLVSAVADLPAAVSALDPSADP